MAETDDRPETPSEDEDDSFENRSEMWTPRIKLGKKHIVSQNKMVHINGAVLQSDEEDNNLSVWMQIGSQHFLLCTLVADSPSYWFSAKICETVPVELYLKGQGRGAVVLYGREKVKA